MYLLTGLISCCTLVSADLLGLPTVPFKSSSDTLFDVASIKNVVVDSKYASTRDHDGWTLIPPTLQEFAQTLVEDLQDVVNCRASVKQADDRAENELFLTLGSSSDFVDAAGRFTSEAYTLNVTDSSVTITGASPLGVWWGTRTLLQQAALHHGKISVGSGTDAPGWGTRGVFFDAGRHYYPPDFLVEMCAWLSFWKQNTFHVHLSDNLYNNVDIYGRERQLDLYARFRLWSDNPAVAGLNKHPNESYTREDFDHIQSACAARGVTVIPEIEAPGHALVISQWKPELGLDGALDLLNISNPDTIPTMESIWSTFLPWFHSKSIHIGADEYVDKDLDAYELGELYNKFVNALNAFIAGVSDKSIRIWGTYPPLSNYTDNINTNVTVQHWEFFEDYPLQDYIQNGYDVINSDDHNYIVTKYSTSYPQHLNRTLIFHGNPEGGAFAPFVFDPNNATNNPSRDNPRVVGHIAAQWNDYGPNTSTYLEAYYSWRGLLPALADKQWGGNLQDEDYDALFAALQPVVPGQNLDRTVESKGDTILKYNFAAAPRPGVGGAQSGTVRDLSGNGYDAKTSCSIADGALQIQDGCSVETPLGSKGHDFTLSMTLKQAADTPGPILGGPDSALYSGNGSSDAVMLITAGNAFPLNYSLPVGQWVDASLVGRGNKTLFSVNGGEEMEFLAKIGINGESFAWANMDVVAPLQTIGGGQWKGAIKSLEVVDHA